MGAYLANPCRDKKSRNGGSFEEGDYTRFGVSEMQGWRQTMEDAHLATPRLVSPSINLGDEVVLSVYGVFDGHGGPSVSEWISRHFNQVFLANVNKAAKACQKSSCDPSNLSEDPVYTVHGRLTASICHALQMTFLDFDELLQQDEHRRELMEIHQMLEQRGVDKKSKQSQDASAEDIPEETLFGGKPQKARSVPPQSGPRQSLFQAIVSNTINPGGKSLIKIVEEGGQKYFHVIGGLINTDAHQGEGTIILPAHAGAPSTNNSSADQTPPSGPGPAEAWTAASDMEELLVPGSTTEPNSKNEETQNVKQEEPSPHSNGSGTHDLTRTPTDRLPGIEEILSSDQQNTSATRENENEAAHFSDDAPPSSVVMIQDAPFLQAAPNFESSDSGSEDNSSSSNPSLFGPGGEKEGVSAFAGTVDSANNYNNKNNSSLPPSNFDSSSSSSEPEEDDSDEEMDEEPGIGGSLMAPYRPENCGAAVVVSVIVGGPNPCLIVANAGDSRCVLSRKGEAIAMSDDHKPQQAFESQRIQAAGGTVVNGRVDGNLNLSRTVGDLFYKKNKRLPAERQKITAFPDVKVIPITKDDEFVILACDGIWDCLTNQEAVEFVRERLLTGTVPAADIVLSNICEQMCERCLAEDPLQSEAGCGCDNMTAVVVHLADKLLQLDSKPSETPLFFTSNVSNYAAKMGEKFEAKFLKTKADMERERVSTVYGNSSGGSGAGAHGQGAKSITAKGNAVAGHGKGKGKKSKNVNTGISAFNNLFSPAARILKRNSSPGGGGAAGDAPMEIDDSPSDKAGATTAGTANGN